MDLIIIKFAVLAICAFVVMGSICRLDMLHASVTRYAFIAIYTLAAIFAFGVALDIIHERTVDWWEVAGVAALALQMYATRDLWVTGPPPSTLRESR